MKARWCWLAMAVACAAAADEGASDARGQKLFRGELALPARIAGQDFALPAEASRCVNCHGMAPAAAASAQRIGPALTSAALTDAVRRRGGPPSRYDAPTLCKLLRSGVDPAHVMILRTMPRYEISDADCQSLWLHLTAAPAR